MNLARQEQPKQRQVKVNFPTFDLLTHHIKLGLNILVSTELNELGQMILPREIKRVNNLGENKDTTLTKTPILIQMQLNMKMKNSNLNQRYMRSRMPLSKISQSHKTLMFTFRDRLGLRMKLQGPPKLLTIPIKC